jgi:hypothetical protein
MYGHKGFKTICIYAPKASDNSLSVLAGGFWDALDANNGVLTPEIRALAGQQIETLKGMKELMSQSIEIDEARPVSVLAMKEYDPIVVFTGLNTTAHPDRYLSDYLVIMPYQLTYGKFAIMQYAAYPDPTHVWNETASVLDHARWDLPEKRFDVTFGNIYGTNAQVYQYDPITNTTSSVDIISQNDTSITVAMLSVDYVRVLVIEENYEGPILINATLCSNATSDVTELYFKTNIPINGEFYCVL